MGRIVHVLLRYHREVVPSPTESVPIPFVRQGNRSASISSSAIRKTRPSAPGKLSLSTSRVMGTCGQGVCYEESRFVLRQHRQSSGSSRRNQRRNLVPAARRRRR